MASWTDQWVWPFWSPFYAPFRVQDRQCIPLSSLKDNRQMLLPYLFRYTGVIDSSRSWCYGTNADKFRQTVDCWVLTPGDCRVTCVARYLAMGHRMLRDAIRHIECRCLRLWLSADWSAGIAPSSFSSCEMRPAWADRHSDRIVASRYC